MIIQISERDAYGRYHCLRGFLGRLVILNGSWVNDLLLADEVEISLTRLLDCVLQLKHKGRVRII